MAMMACLPDSTECSKNERKKGADVVACEIYSIQELCDYRYVVILSRYRGALLLSRHRQRSTWEAQGGHIESGETPLEAAKRELYEESGAVQFTIEPLCDYRAGDGTSYSNGVVFVADVAELGPMPDSEMEETQCFLRLPESLTYPEILPKMYAYLLTIHPEFFRDDSDSTPRSV